MLRENFDDYSTAFESEDEASVPVFCVSGRTNANMKANVPKPTSARARGLTKIQKIAEKLDAANFFANLSNAEFAPGMTSASSSANTENQAPGANERDSETGTSKSSSMSLVSQDPSNDENVIRLEDGTFMHPKRLEDGTVMYPQRLEDGTVIYAKNPENVIRLEDGTITYPKRLEDGTVMYPKRLEDGTVIYVKNPQGQSGATDGFADPTSGGPEPGNNEDEEAEFSEELQEIMGSDAKLSEELQNILGSDAKIAEMLKVSSSASSQYWELQNKTGCLIESESSEVFLGFHLAIKELEKGVREMRKSAEVSPEEARARVEEARARVEESRKLIASQPEVEEQMKVFAAAGVTKELGSSSCPFCGSASGIVTEESLRVWVAGCASLAVKVDPTMETLSALQEMYRNQK